MLLLRFLFIKLINIYIIIIYPKIESQFIFTSILFLLCSKGILVSRIYKFGKLLSIFILFIY